MFRQYHTLDDKIYFLKTTTIGNNLMGNANLLSRYYGVYNDRDNKLTVGRGGSWRMQICRVTSSYDDSVNRPHPVLPFTVRVPIRSASKPFADCECFHHRIIARSRTSLRCPTSPSGARFTSRSTRRSSSRGSRNAALPLTRPLS